MHALYIVMCSHIPCTVYHESFYAKVLRQVVHTDFRGETFTEFHILYMRALHVTWRGIIRQRFINNNSCTTESCVRGFHVYRDTWKPKKVNCSNVSMKKTILMTGMQRHLELSYKQVS